MKEDQFFGTLRELPFELIVLESPDQGTNFFVNELNKKAERIFKHHRPDLLGKNFEDICNPKSFGKILKGLQTALKSGKTQTLRKQPFLDNKLKNLHIAKPGSQLVAVTAYPSAGEHQEDIELVRLDLEKYRQQIDRSSSGIIEADKEGGILEYNSKAEALFQLDTLNSLVLLDIPILSNSEVPERFRQCLEYEEPVQGEAFIEHNDSKLSLKYQFSPLKNNDDKVYGAIGVFDDCTRIHEMEDKLRESDAHYRDLVKLLPEVVFETDREGTITFTNDKALEIFEYTREELNKGMNLFDCLVREDRERARINFQSVLQGRQSDGNEYQAITKSGKVFPVLIYSSPIKKNDKPIGLRGLVVTISKLKKAEEALEKSEKNFRQLAENIREGFWLCNMENKILYANPACRMIAEREMPEVSPYPDIFFNWIHPEDKERIKHEMEINEEHPEDEHIYEHRIITPTEKVKWLGINISPVYNEKGQLYRRTGLVSDISHQKSLILDLVKAKEKAEESDKLKSSFLANMSHEIRTPMNGILGFAELLRSPESTDKEKKEYLNIIQKNGTHLLSLINDILDIAKIEAGQLPLNKKPFELNQFMWEIHNNYKNQYVEKLKYIDFSFVPDAPEEAIKIYSDPERIHQILSNLLVNAFKFTSKGSIQFGYQLNYNVNRKKYIKFFVADTGKGIDKKDFTLIFDRFGQVHKEDNYQKGAGLGLTITKNLVRMMEGRIWLDSQKGKGSTFYFIIPDKREEPLKEKSAEQETEALYEEYSKTILIVEDDIINQKYLEKLLDKTSIQLITTKTGEKAIEVVNNNPAIDLILMDIRLPGINGYETARAIKKINKNIPIIAQTAYAMQEDQNKSIAMGCDDYISKPIDQNVLFNKLNDYLYTNKKS
jgi:PAS domain S-box-containing protein